LTSKRVYLAAIDSNNSLLSLLSADSCFQAVLHVQLYLLSEQAVTYLSLNYCQHYFEFMPVLVFHSFNLGLVQLSESSSTMVFIAGHFT